MSQRTSWIKTGIVVVIVFLFFVIVNGFFRENNKLLKERVFWQEKADSFEKQYNKVLEENSMLSSELNAVEDGLSIIGVNLESAGFLPGGGNDLTYIISIEVENTTNQKSAGATGFSLFSLLNHGGKRISSTAWRSFAVPELGPGEKRAFKISGKVSARPKAELLIFVNILGEPGLAKIRVTVPEKPTSPPIVKKEEPQDPPAQIKPNSTEPNSDKPLSDKPVSTKPTLENSEEDSKEGRAEEEKEEKTEEEKSEIVTNESAGPAHTSEILKPGKEEAVDAQ